MWGKRKEKPPDRSLLPVTSTGFTISGYFTSSGYELGIILIYVYHSTSTGEEGVERPDWVSRSGLEVRLVWSVDGWMDG